MLHRMRARLMKSKTGLLVIVPAILLTLITITFTLLSCTNTVANRTAETTSPAAKPKFQVIGLGVNPAEVIPGEEVQVVATITNTGESGEYVADLKINGVTDEIRKVDLPAGARQDITFRLSRETPQFYKVSLDGITGQFVVKAKEQNTSTASSSAPVNPSTSQPSTSQPAPTQRRSCCQ